MWRAPRSCHPKNSVSSVDVDRVLQAEGVLALAQKDPKIPLL